MRRHVFGLNSWSVESLPVARNPLENRADVIKRFSLELIEFGWNLEVGGRYGGEREIIIPTIPYRPNAVHRASAVVCLGGEHQTGVRIGDQRFVRLVFQALEARHIARVEGVNQNHGNLLGERT